MPELKTILLGFALRCPFIYFLLCDLEETRERIYKKISKKLMLELVTMMPR